MNISFIKPNKEKLTSFVTLGISLILISFLDIIFNTFFEFNITGFLPDKVSYLAPLIIGVIGLYFIRIEFSGNKALDKINTNFNSSNINAALTLLVIFALIKFIPPVLNWFVFDADFLGNSKEDCTSGGACWVFVKVWFNRFLYGMYPDAEQWRINTAFFMLFSLVGAAFFVPERLKKYLLIFLLFVYPIIGLKLISGGDFGLKFVETGAWGGLSLTFIVSAPLAHLALPQPSKLLMLALAQPALPPPPKLLLLTLALLTGCAVVDRGECSLVLELLACIAEVLSVAMLATWDLLSKMVVALA